jgi:hypothetical protein
MDVPAEKFFLEKTFPDSTTCVLGGRLDAVANFDFSKYQAILWMVDSNGTNPKPHGIAPELVQVVRIDTLSNEGLETIIDKFCECNPRHLPSVYLTREVLGRNSVIYDSLIPHLHGHLETVNRARVTRQEDGFTWQKNVLLNIEYWTRQRMPASWAGELSGVPAFICGAGPSLDISALKLSAAAKKGVVFSADSALNALAKYNVMPDFAVSIDIAKAPEKCLVTGKIPNRVLVSAISPAAWVNAVPQDNLFFLSGRQITEDWFTAQGLDRTGIATSESCGSTALELAHYLGCSPIYLFGMDLAADATDPIKRHMSGADSTLYKDSGYDPARQLPKVPGNYVDKLPTFLLGDLRPLNARLSTWPSELVHNVNDRGAVLENTTLVHPDHFKAPKFEGDIQSTLEHLASPTITQDHIVKVALSRLRAAGAYGLDTIPMLRTLLAQGGPSDLVIGLRKLWCEEDFPEAMGAFSFKLMPHLTLPVEGDEVFWKKQLDELEDLVQLAAKQGKPTV